MFRLNGKMETMYSVIEPVYIFYNGICVFYIT